LRSGPHPRCRRLGTATAKLQGQGKEQSAKPPVRPRKRDQGRLLYPCPLEIDDLLFRSQSISRSRREQTATTSSKRTRPSRSRREVAVRTPRLRRAAGQREEVSGRGQQPQHTERTPPPPTPTARRQ